MFFYILVKDIVCIPFWLVFLVISVLFVLFELVNFFLFSLCVLVQRIIGCQLCLFNYSSHVYENRSDRFKYIFNIFMYIVNRDIIYYMMNFYKSIFRYFNVLFYCQQFNQWNIDSLSLLQSLIIHTPFFIFYIFIGFVFSLFSVIKLFDILTLHYFHEKYRLPCLRDIITLFCFLVVYIPCDIITLDRYSFFEEINGYISTEQIKRYLWNDFHDIIYNIAEIFTLGMYIRPSKRLERMLKLSKVKKEYIIKIKIIDESDNVNDREGEFEDTLNTQLLPDRV